MTQEEKETMENVAYGAIVLNLSDNVLKEVIGEETTYGMWKKLEELYQSKDLPNRAYMRERFLTYKMDDNKSLIENLGEFKKLSLDFRELKDKIGDENE
ncbi:Retrovirus-related Pol polyprotein from transposon TNT 1-94 [Cucumis melo var. makuwa]|uniref:Retrovirus-related Pol polyprotein from transposon TNT 1-94 n=1 Tax=Cucumis melo var. makuwa TaxID=1194695 RepID=A0A5D3BAU2_CUCMM|nr:Retrovirus-related Pol polyprotein from transposon TNT 1-94 [Cucumis melo var. makuwa]